MSSYPGSRATGPEIVHDSSTLDDRLAELRRCLSALGKVVVAFSGGADSAFLARVATDELGRENVLCVTAVSPSLAPEELSDLRALASEWSLRHEEVVTDELADPRYRANDGTRCAHCKGALLDAVAPIATIATATVVLGVNVDDLGDHRPGQQVAAERGAVFPLVQAGFTKNEVRQASKKLGLRTWDKPAAACLASRIPYGTPVTIQNVKTVDRGEEAIRALGFRQFRVRFHGDIVRIEVAPEELARAMTLEMAHKFTAIFKPLGFHYVTLDLEGYRQGSLNAVLS